MNENKIRHLTYLDRVANMDLPTRASAIPPVSKDTNVRSTFDKGKLTKYILLCSWLSLMSAMLYISIVESASERNYLALTKKQRYELSEFWYKSQAISLDIGVEADTNDRLTLSKPLKQLMAKGVYLDCLRVIDVAHYQLDMYRLAGTATFTSPTSNTMFSVGVLSYYAFSEGKYDHRYTNIVFPDGALDKIMSTQDHSVIKNTKVSEYRVDGTCTALPFGTRAKTNDNAFFAQDKPKSFLFYRHLVSFFSNLRG